MHFRKLDLNLLVALDALIRHQSVSMAADELHLSQSAMSNSLARLRDYFQDDLLIKVGRKMELSSHARQLEQPVRDILVSIDASLLLKPEFDPTTSEREFRICVSDYTLYTLIPHVLEVAADQNSRVKLNLQSQVSDPKKELDRGEADLLIMPELFCSDDHPSEFLHEDRYGCLVWKGSKLATEQLNLDNFLAAQHMCMQPPNSNPSFETLSYKNAGIERNVAVRSFSFACMPALLQGSELVATLQGKLIRKVIAQGFDLISFPTPVELPPLKESMQWHKHRDSDPGMKWLRSVVKQAVQRIAF